MADKQKQRSLGEKQRQVGDQLDGLTGDQPQHRLRARERGRRHPAAVNVRELLEQRLAPRVATHRDALAQPRRAHHLLREAEGEAHRRRRACGRGRAEREAHVHDAPPLVPAQREG